MRAQTLEHLNMRKAALTAIVINSLQIMAAAALALYVLLDGKADTLHGPIGSLVLMVLVCIVVCGAALDIKEGVNAVRVAHKMGGLNETVEQMSDFNHALRAQRHDFLNHWQVVYSLIEMNEPNEALDYIERVYGDMRTVSQALRTKCAPVNALLRAKLTEGQKQGLQMVTNITGMWEGLPMPAWEMCRVLSNLIDNGMDALEGVKDGRIIISLAEDLHAFSFCVENNGPVVQESIRDSIFEAGISTKGAGRGMGLAIARETMRTYGGDLTLASVSGRTAFSGFVPKTLIRPTKEEK